MHRMATTLALSLWAGFFSVCGLRLAAAADLFGTSSALSTFFGWFGAAPEAAALTDLGSVAAAGFAVTMMALAFAGLASILGLSTSYLGEERAEAAAGGVLAAMTVFYLAADIAAPPVAALFGDALTVLFLLAASFGALWFDAVFSVGDREEDRQVEAILVRIREAEREAIRANWEKAHRRDGGGR